MTETASEFARKLFAGPCDFIWGASNINNLPPQSLREVAFVGRSNVGKSSLINALTGRKTVARVSQTPGRTRELNFFNLGGKLMLVDLPGYGYAKASRSLAQDWQTLAFAYMSGRATGLSGKDGNLVVARKLAMTRTDPATGKKEAVDMGFVGEPDKINPEVLHAIMKSETIPVIAPIGVGPKGETYNINADTVSGAVASALNAERLILLTDVEGVLDQDKKVIPRLTVREARALIADGTISGGMIPKIQTAIDAVEGGVNAAVILDGRIPHVLLLELFTEHGAGTLITAA